MITANQIKKGIVFNIDDKLYQVVDFNWVIPGKGNTVIQTKLKSLDTGSIIDKRLRPSEKLEVAYLEKKPMEYLYKDGDNYVFMDTETYEQHPYGPDILGDAMDYLKENTQVMVETYEGNPINIELPPSVELKVVQTEQSIKGATATNQYKPAIMETGLKISVPPFINEGELVRVDTRTGEYLERAK